MEEGNIHEIKKPSKNTWKITTKRRMTQNKKNGTSSRFYSAKEVRKGLKIIPKKPNGLRKLSKIENAISSPYQKTGKTGFLWGIRANQKSHKLLFLHGMTKP